MKIVNVNRRLRINDAARCLGSSSFYFSFFFLEEGGNCTVSNWKGIKVDSFRDAFEIQDDDDYDYDDVDAKTGGGRQSRATQRELDGRIEMVLLLLLLLLLYFSLSLSLLSVCMCA